MRFFLACALLASSCGDNDGNSAAIDAFVPRVDAATDAQAIDAAIDLRGPRTVTLPGGANSVLWDNATGTLFLTDNNGIRLMRYKDATGLEQVSTLPNAGMISLGDIVKETDGTILVANFGFGATGTIFALPPTGPAVPFTGLAADRKRVGLVKDSAGQHYTSYFTGAGATPVGGVSSLAIAGTVATETDLATTFAFKKLVGIVAHTDAVFVSDQTQKKIFKIALPAQTVTTLADVPSADLLAEMPNGDLLTSGTAVHRITPAGVVTLTDLGTFESVRGMAYDNTLKRLFLIEHSTTVGVLDRLHILPLDE
ncbi:MAG: hypothetical protein ABI867_32945 [Kofleriaceae bacterium]